MLRVPELGAILAEAGLAPRWQGEIDRMLQARSEYMAVEKKLDELHRAAGAKRVVLPEELRLRLESAERAVGEAIDGFSRPMEGVDRPGKLIGQLRSLSGLLHELAAGANDGYGYDLDLVHQHLAWALLDAARWAGKNFRD